MIREYIRLFTFVTKHGVYIDGFAAPQRRNHKEKCSAKLVLENEPQWIRQLYLCDIDPFGCDILREIKEEHTNKRQNIDVIEGDFNVTVHDILSKGLITEKTATFALLDQRTFECAWSTVETLAKYKRAGNKIEQFYFFPTGWIDRSIAAISRNESERRAETWWGRRDWKDLQGMDRIARANLVADRFKDELGYKWALPFAIHSGARGGRTMYHMIHASDHDEAPKLMLRAYRKVSGRSDWDRAPTQLEILDFIENVER